MSEAIVTITPTIMDGTVVRWFVSPEAAERCEPHVSASRNGMRRHRVPAPEAWLIAAEKTWHALINQQDVSGLATHARDGLFGPLRPVTEGDRQ